VSADANGGEGADLVLGEGDVYGVARDLGNGPDRDRDLPPSPEVATLEDEVCDVLVRVDDEAVHVPKRMTVRRDHDARPSDLDLALRHAVVVEGHVGGHLARIRVRAETGVVRHREDILDPDVPVGVLGGTLSEPEVGRLIHRLEPLHVTQSAFQLDLAPLVVSALRQLDGHQPRLSHAVLRLNHEMRHPLLERVDDDVRQLAVRPVGAADAITQLEAHVQSPLHAAKVERSLRAEVAAQPALGLLPRDRQWQEDWSTGSGG